MSVWDQRVHQTKNRSWKTNCLLVLAACHKLGQGDRVHSLHEPSKSVRVGEGQGRTKAFPNFLCIWTDKEQVLFIFYIPQVVALTKPLYVWHALPRTQHYLKLCVATLKLSQSFLQLNTIDVTQVAFALVRHILEAQIFCLHGPDFVVGKELFNENQSHIILHPFYTQHCVRKTWKGWDPSLLVDRASHRRSSTNQLHQLQCGQLSHLSSHLYVVHVTPKYLAFRPASHPYQMGWMYVRCPRNHSQQWLRSPRLECTNHCKLRCHFQRRLNRRQKICYLLGLILKQPFLHGSNPTFLSRSKHSELSLPCLSQDVVFSDNAHTIIIQQRLSPCKVFKGEFAKFCQHNGCAGCFSHPEQGFEEPLVHYFNSLYFLKIHPNLTSITCYGTHQRVEEVTAQLNVHDM